MADLDRRGELYDIRLSGTPTDLADAIEVGYDPTAGQLTEEEKARMQQTADLLTYYQAELQRKELERLQEVEEQRNLIALYEEGIAEVTRKTLLAQQEAEALQESAVSLEGELEELEESLEKQGAFDPMKPFRDIAIVAILVMVVVVIVGVAR